MSSEYLGYAERTIAKFVRGGLTLTFQLIKTHHVRIYCVVNEAIMFKQNSFVNT